MPKPTFSVAPGHTETVFDNRTFRKLVEQVSEAVEYWHKLHKFDVLVGCGNSGVPLLGAVSFYTGIPMLVVRKSRSDMGHDSNMVNGTLVANGRWVFLDDFIASGRTFLHVAREIEAACVKAYVAPMTAHSTIAYGTTWTDDRDLSDYDTGKRYTFKAVAVNDVLAMKRNS